MYKSRQELRTNKKKHRFSKFWVSFLILTIIAYVVTVFYFSWYSKSVPDSLTYTFLVAALGQLSNMALIARKGKDVEIAELKYDCECMKISNEQPDQFNYAQKGDG